MHTTSLVSTSLIAALAACSGGGQQDPIIVRGPDAAIDAPKICGATANYGAATPSMESAIRDADTMPEQLYYDAALNSDPKFDDLSIQLFKGYGAFEVGEIAPKLISLTGGEAQFETCGACVLLYANMDPANDYADEGIYMAVGGTLNISSVSPNIKGNLINTRLVEVSIDEDTSISTPLGNCAAEIASLQFDFPVTTDTGEEEPALTGPTKRIKKLHKPRR